MGKYITAVIFLMTGIGTIPAILWIIYMTMEEQAESNK